MQETINSHNGFITITNPETGDHRTLRIRTQLEGTWREGARLVGLLTGSDNTRDYTNFGEVTEKGAVKIWGKFQSKNGTASAHEVYARMLEDPETFQDRGIEYQFDTRCRVCNRTLTHPQSITSGIGPTCAKNVGISQDDYYSEGDEDSELVRSKFTDNPPKNNVFRYNENAYQNAKRVLRKILDSMDQMYEKKILRDDWLRWHYTLPVEANDYQLLDNAITAFEDWLKRITKDDYGYVITESSAIFRYGDLEISLYIDSDTWLLHLAAAWTE